MADTQIRPMNLGEILDRTFGLYRNHFRLFVGIMALPAALAAIGGLVLQFFQEPLVEMQRDAPGEISAEMIGMVLLVIFGSLVFVLVYWVLYSFALGATTCALTSLLKGGRMTVREAYGSVGDRLLGLVFLPIVIFIFLLAAGLGAGLVVALIGGGASAISEWIGIPLIIVGGFGILIFMLWLVLGYSVTVPTLIIEGIGILESMKRSFDLMRGHRLRALLILVLMILIGYAANLILQAPLIVSTIVEPMRGGTPPLWLRSLGAVGAGIAGALTGPLLTLGLALLYFDVRVRKEPFDPAAEDPVTGPAKAPSIDPSRPLDHLIG